MDSIAEDLDGLGLRLTITGYLERLQRVTGR